MNLLEVDSLESNEHCDDCGGEMVHAFGYKVCRHCSAPPSEPAEAEVPDPGDQDLRFTEIAVAGCSNTGQTQSDFVIIGLDQYGRIWKQWSCAEIWHKDPMKRADG